MDLFSFDDDYVRRLREGHYETGVHFNTYFTGVLHAKLGRRLHSADAVDELTQDVLFLALKSLHLLKAGSKLGAFVDGICNNRLKMHYRAERRTVPLVDQSEPVDHNRNAEEIHEANETAALVRATLKELGEPDAGILTAIFLNEESKDVICARYRVSSDYLRVLLFRAKAAFRELYKRRKKKK
jgi:DNA-directed RNA polymerase specialized sigma24 family protein